MGLRLTNNAGGNGRFRLTNSLGTNGRVRIWLSQPSSNNPDAQAFITAAGITDPTQQSAINTLVISMKANGTWTKCNAIYPMVGGTATTCKFNLKNPLDTDAAFRLNFQGGWSFSANGALPNGTNAYADTLLNPTTTLTLNSSHISYYSRTDIAEGIYDIGAAADPAAYLALNARNTSNNFRILVNTGIVSDVANTDSRGNFIANRTASNVMNGFKNATKVHNTSILSVAQPNRSIYLGALNFQTTGGAVLFSNKQCAFATIGEGLTDTEAGTLYTDIQAFQTTLGRQV
jgi:hypothetical protein